MYELFEFETPNYQSTTFPPPRPFQDAAHETLRQGARAGHRCQMISAPTGAGKTYIAMRIAHEALKKGRRALFVCDRTALINQTSAAADRYGLTAHGVIQADHHRTNLRLPFQIASVQTLARRKWPDADVAIIDEAHCQYSAWVEYAKTTTARVVGLSATPFSKGLGLIFTNLINAATMAELTASGVLVPMRVFSCTRIDMRGAEIAKDGEWADSAAERQGIQIVGDVVTEWCKLAMGRKTIVFGATIKHCEEITRQFNEAGIMAACFTSHTKDDERENLLSEYRKPDSMLRVLVSVEALAKGFDVPDVECVCDCRPLRKSLSTAIQMWGRGLRSSPDTGKTECLLLDFSGNIVRFAEDFSDIFHNGLDALDAGEKLDKAIRKEPEDDPDGKKCPACGFQPMGRKCIACGHEVRSASEIIQIAGQCIDITDKIMVGKAKAADNALHLWQQCCTHARGHGNPEKAAGRAWHLFQEIAGYVPPRSLPRFEDTPNAEITRAVYNKIQQKRIAYAKAMAGRAA